MAFRFFSLKVNQPGPQANSEFSTGRSTEGHGGMTQTRGRVFFMRRNSVPFHVRYGIWINYCHSTVFMK